MNILGVLSGKGGTGKTTICAHMARFWTENGKKIGIFDADITGSNIITALGGKVDKPISVDKNKVIPAQVDNIQVFSTDLYKPISRDRGAPLLRSGAWKSDYIRDVFSSIVFDVDYLLIDFPPGVDDHSLELLTLLNMKAVVVSTPDPKSLENAKECLVMLKFCKIPVLGVIETMRKYEYNDGKKIKLLPHIDGPDIKKNLKTDLLVSIPFKPNFFSYTKQDPGKQELKGLITKLEGLI